MRHVSLIEILKETLGLGQLIHKEAPRTEETNKQIKQCKFVYTKLALTKAELPLLALTKAEYW